jgi:hypothetical protein
MIPQRNLGAGLKAAHLGIFSLLIACHAPQAAAQSADPALAFGIGWSAMNINDIEFQAITDFLVTEVTDHQSNEDGRLNGYKFTGELTGLMPHMRGAWLTTVGIKGFYSRYEDEEQTRCVFTANSDCVFFPLVDPDTTNITPDASGGFFSDWLTDVERKVVYWGGALEFNFSRADAAPVQSLKDAPAPLAPAPFQWHAALSLRQLDQDMSLFSVDSGPTADPVTLNDDLNTNYYGGYVGFTSWKELGYGLRLNLKGETGLYYAQTDYDGAYTASASLGDNSPVAASVSLSDDAPAFIGLLHLLLEKDVSATTTIGLFGEAEWLSYVPKVLYNDTDLNGGVPFDVVGSQDGTELGEGSAFTYTVGARLRIRMQ